MSQQTMEAQVSKAQAPATRQDIENAVSNAKARYNRSPMTPQSIDTAINNAKARWNRNNQPDRFITRTPTRNGDVLEHVNVHIYHHETFPLGGQTFTIDVRTLPDDRQNPGELLHRTRFHLAPEEALR